MKVPSLLWKDPPGPQSKLTWALSSQVKEDMKFSTVMTSKSRTLSRWLLQLNGLPWGGLLKFRRLLSLTPRRLLTPKQRRLSLSKSRLTSFWSRLFISKRRVVNKLLPKVTESRDT